jgi:O-antigen/teichoic acid export membrane protein
MPQVIIKEVAIGYSRCKWNHVGNVMYSSYLLNGIITIILSSSLILLAPRISNQLFDEPKLIFPLTVAFIALIPQVFSRIFSSGLIGYNKIWQSNLADQTLSFMVIGVLLLAFHYSNVDITINLVAIVYAIGRLSVMLTLGIYWNTLRNRDISLQFIGSKLLKTSFPLLLVSYTAVLASTSSGIILGWLSNAEMVGVFSVATRIATLTSFFLLITNSALSPKIAALYASNRKHEMEKMVQRVTLGLILIGLVSLLLFIIFGRFILNFWGEDFTEGYLILIILSIGQFVNIGTGASGLILMMCGLEKTHRNISLLSLIISLILNVVLIHFYNIVGAAIATTCIMTSENIFKLIYAKRKVNVSTIPFIYKK